MDKEGRYEAVVKAWCDMRKQLAETSGQQQESEAVEQQCRWMDDGAEVEDDTNEQQ